MAHSATEGETIMKLPVMLGMLRIPALPRNAVAADGGEVAGSRSDGAGRAVPQVVQAGDRRHPRRSRLLRPGPARMVRHLAAVSVVALAGAGLAASPAAAQGTADWPAFLFDTGHSSHNAAATSIGTGNLANLQPVWEFMQPFGSNRNFYASPTVVNGVVY